MIHFTINSDTTELQLGAMAAAIAVIQGKPATVPAAPSVSVDMTPAVPDAPVTPEQNTTELDIEGYPWDERIHSSSKAQTADGAWRKKRGVDPADVDRVQAELKGVPEAPADVPAAPAAPEAPADVPAAPAAPEAPAAVTPAIVFKFMTDNKIDGDRLTAALGMVGFEKTNDLFKSPDKAGEFLAALEAVSA